MSAQAINDDTWKDEAVRAATKRNEFQTYICGPEMSIEQKSFSALMSDPAFTRNFRAHIVDEAHCIHEWGPEFRPLYAEIGDLMSSMPRRIPYLISSATLPPEARKDVYDSLNIDPEKAFILNLGNNRPNICHETRIVQNVNVIRLPGIERLI